MKKYFALFDAKPLRERALLAVTLVVAVVFLWWNYQAEPLMTRIESQQRENQRIAGEVDNLLSSIQTIRDRIAAGVNREKQAKLARLRQQLETAEEELRVKTVELIDPEKMFELMNQLIYRDSRLKLLNLKRRDVQPAIPVSEEDPESDEPTIYRHVLEMEFSGSFVDIVKYMQAMEDLDWKLLWDEIDIVSEEYPKVTVKVVISTLSTQREWVGI